MVLDAGMGYVLPWEPPRDLVPNKISENRYPPWGISGPWAPLSYHSWRWWPEQGALTWVPHVQESWEKSRWKFAPAFTCSIDEWNGKYLKPETLSISPSKTRLELLWPTWRRRSLCVINHFCLGRVHCSDRPPGWSSPARFFVQCGSPGPVDTPGGGDWRAWLQLCSRFGSPVQLQTRRVRTIVCNYVALKTPSGGFGGIAVGVMLLKSLS